VRREGEEIGSKGAEEGREEEETRRLERGGRRLVARCSTDEGGIEGGRRGEDRMSARSWFRRRRRRLRRKERKGEAHLTKRERGGIGSDRTRFVLLILVLLRRWRIEEDEGEEDLV